MATKQLTAVMTCPKCGMMEHSQDKIYGMGKRLFTQKLNGNKWQCTRCGNFYGDAPFKKDAKK